MSDTPSITNSDTLIFSEKGYIFSRVLGEGSYAKVWLVKYNMVINEEEKFCNLACKVIDSKTAQPDFISKFLPREMDILAKISHPHLIHLHSIYQRKSKIFIFMRFAEKGDLLDRILIEGEVNEKQARLWTRQLALGLQYLHNLDIVHRDIKCENVLITANNNVKLGDFGFARFMVDNSGKYHLSSTYCGSLAYAAPELLKGRPYNPKHSDVWSLGVVLFVMLNQCMPFSDNDMNKLYETQMNCSWTFRRKIHAAVSEDVKALVRSMLIPDTNRRIIIDDVVNHHWFSYDERLRVMSHKEREALETGLSNKTEIIPRTTKLSIPSWKKRKKNEQLVCITSMREERSSNQFQFQPFDNPRRSVNIRDRVSIRKDGRENDDGWQDHIWHDEVRQDDIWHDEGKQDDRRQNERRQDERRQDDGRQNERRQDDRKQDDRRQEERHGTSEQQRHLAANPFPYNLRPKATTSSVDLLVFGSEVLPGTSELPGQAVQSKLTRVKSSNITSSKIMVNMSLTAIQPKSGETNPKMRLNEVVNPEKKELDVDALSFSDEKFKEDKKHDEKDKQLK